MKKSIHPNYRPVIFFDTSCNYSFLTRSTVETSETMLWKDGKEYPVFKTEVTSKSHAFYTGQKMNLNNASGNIDKFFQRYNKK